MAEGVATTAGQAPRRRLPGLLSGRDESGVARALITPGQLLLAFLVGFPAVVAIYIAFTGWTPTTGREWFSAWRFWLWFDNYWEALSGGGFWHAILKTLLIVVLAVGVEFVAGFGLALLFVRTFRGRSLLTVLFLLPMMVVPAVAGFIFYMLFQTDGPINAALGIHVGWLTDPDVAPYSIMLVDIWQWTPLMFLIFLSGLVALPDDQLNAARILGASWWHQLRYLVLPMMKPIVLIALIIRGMEAFKIFDAPWLMAQGGPGDSTTTISVYLYRQVAIATRWSYASAAAILVLIMVSAIAIRAIRPIEVAQEETVEEPLADRAVDLERAIEAEARV